jgi:orotate phosphoribosyltransferase
MSERRAASSERALWMAVVLAARCALLAGAVVDRIAALVDRQVITVSEVSQMADIRFFPRKAGQSDDDYRHNILESLIAQALRFRDVERFGAEDIPKDSIESRFLDIQKRFPSAADFAAAMQRAELSPDEVRALVKRQLQVDAYIQERFAPMIFVSTDEIEAYYRGDWSQQRRQRGLPIPPLADVTEEIRTLLKSNRLQSEIDRWTTQLRARANVDIYTWR